MITKKIVEHKMFNSFIIWIIVLNAIIMWFETSKDFQLNYSDFLNIFHWGVIMIFFIEALLKIMVYKKEYFKSWWNLFDFSLVIISLLPTDWIFQILRILRVFRILRLITIIPSMRKIVSAIFSIIPGILSLSGLLFIIFYVYAIIWTELFWEYFPQWFWTLWASLYTLFQVMTLESWSMGIARPVMEQFTYSWIFFITFIFIATFIMINLVIAIVVEAMNKISHKEEDIIIAEIKESEKITKKDLKLLEQKINKLYDLLNKK